MASKNSTISPNKKGFFVVWFYDDCSGGGCGFDNFSTREEAIKDYETRKAEKDTDYYLLTVIEGEAIKGFF